MSPKIVISVVKNTSKIVIEIMPVLFALYQTKIYSENFEKLCSCFEETIFVLFCSLFYYESQTFEILFENIFLCLYTCSILFSKPFFFYIYEIYCIIISGWKKLLFKTLKCKVIKVIYSKLLMQRKTSSKYNPYLN